MEHRPDQTALCLRLHASYLCRHSGACCTAGWAIPVETPAFERLLVHFGQSSRRGQMFAHGEPPPDAAAILGNQPGGACIFFESDRGNLCAVHRELGAEWLPAACQHFPRIVLRDGRGTRLSLSHYCPTAAALLLSPDAAQFEIVAAPAGLALTNGAEGLDARAALPPLLRPGMLTDPEGYDAWERCSIGVLARPDVTAERALRILTAATAGLRSWRPGDVPLHTAVAREFDVASAREPDEDPSVGSATGVIERIVSRMELATSAVPEGLPRPSLIDVSHRWADVAEWWSEVDGAVRAYLAARLFGNWIAYYGQGLDTIVEYLQVALAVVKLESVRQHQLGTSASPAQTVTAAIRNADLLLVHLADTRTLVNRLR